MEYDKIISLTNLFQHLLSAEIYPDMGISRGIWQLYKWCPMLVLPRQKKNAIVKVFTYVVFLFRFYSVVGNS